MKMVIRVGALLLLATAAARAVEAQDRVVTLRPGESVTGELTATAPRLEGLRFQTYRFAARSGSRYRAILTSEDFEPTLRIGREVGGVTEYLVTGGYHGLGRAATLEFSTTADGTYLIVAQSADEGTGRYTLALDPAPPSAPARLRVGEAVSGLLELESVHPFEVTTEGEVRVTLRSREFDTLLEVGRSGPNGFEPLLSDDDGGGETDSRVYFTAPATGEYLARVTAYGGSGGGSYAILLDIPAPIRAPDPLEPDVAVTGALEDSDPVGDDGFPFDDWTIRASAGGRFRVDLTSADFDAYLAVGRGAGRNFQEIMSNDDSGAPELGAMDARLVLVASESGEYTLRVRGFSEDERGSYSLIARTLPPASTHPEGGALRLGQQTDGELTETDAVLPDGSPYEEWRFTAVAGQRIELAAVSDDFDTYLLVGTASGAEFQEVAENDDWAGSANGTDSRLTFTAAESREYVARVRAFSADGFGAYRLTVVEAPPVRVSPFEGRVEPGRTVGAALEEVDARLADDAPYHHWVFDAGAGQALVIDLGSADFDAYLSVGRIADGQYVELAENDDFGNGTDSQITFVAPQAGEYVIRVRPYSPEERGRYSLTLTER